MRGLALALLLTGCATTNLVDGAALRPEYSVALDTAVQEWNVAHPCARLRREDGTSSRAFVRLYEKDSGGAWSAQTWMSLHRTYLAPDTIGSWAVRVIEHELGHLLGLGHSPDPTSLMYGGAPFEMRGPESVRVDCD